jgi:hypothetical protein
MIKGLQHLMEAFFEEVMLFVFSEQPEKMGLTIPYGYDSITTCGSSSVVEFLLPKQAVAGSSPVSRSKHTGSQF